MRLMFFWGSSKDLCIALFVFSLSFPFILFDIGQREITVRN
jgi:hypothetical protein